MAGVFLAPKTKPRRVCFFDLADKSRRRQIAFGSIPKADAEAIKSKVEKLRASRLADTTPPDAVIEWVRQIPDEWHQRLEEAGYVAKRESRSRSMLTVGELIERFKGRAQWSRNSEGTRGTYARTFRHLQARFEASRPIDSITVADATDLRPFLEAEKPAGRGLGISTASATITQIKTLFDLAVDDGHIDRNPFAKIKTPQFEAEKPFIPAKVCQAVMDELPTDEWCLLFALARWGGLRIISEVEGMQWGHVDFANRELRVLSPKTRRHPNGHYRFVPIFDEVLPLLERQFDAAADGELYVLPYVRRNKSVVRETVLRAITAAGHTAWPELFNTLRSTRETELCQLGVPLSEVAEIIGHSVRVAERNYLQQMGRERRHAMLAKASTKSLTNSTANGETRRDADSPAVSTSRSA
ncbi:MAG: tyrosine-type recombinase/integrase [Planctomycetota bacterium]